MVALSGVRQVDWKAIRLPLPCIKYEAASSGHNSICCRVHPPDLMPHTPMYWYAAPIWHHHQIEIGIGIGIKIKCLSAIWFSSKAHQTHYVAFSLTIWANFCYVTATRFFMP